MSGLPRLRDLWIESARTLIEDFVDATPPEELGGILGRAGEVLGALSPCLDEFAELPFSGPDYDPEGVEELLMAARRIPRCVLAFATELERSEEDRAWAFLRERATTLRYALRGLQHAWLLQGLGVDLSESLPPPPLRSLARLGQAANLEHLGSLFAPEPGESEEPGEPEDDHTSPEDD